MGYQIGVDIGGSFADFAVVDDDTGELRALKVFSRPDVPGTEVIDGIRQLEIRYGIMPSAISYFTHGITVGVNSVIQRNGLKLSLLATEGFVDVLEMARLKSKNMYDLFSCRPAPLISRDRVFPVRERMGADGESLLPVDPASVERALADARAAGSEGVLISFLHSYRNPEHEKRAREIALSLAPDLPIFISSEVWPIVREYERTITATVSSYVQPRVARYIGSLQDALKQLGIACQPYVTKSNGGVMTAEQGKSQCIQMILSGTASGVIGAAYVAKKSGVRHALSLDIGGTSADLALILDGKPQYGIGEVIGDFQIFIPSVSVASIGSGGGSIASVDEFGVLKVGPESAGSTPGPACYGRGGSRPTITDSFVVRNIIGGEDLGYGHVHVDKAASKAALMSLSERLGINVEQTAEAIEKVAVSGMYNGVSALLSQFGVDPRDFTMVAFGGAGPMIAASLADAVGVPEVLIPLTPGVLSALGGLVADIKNDFILSRFADLEAAAATDLRAGWSELESRARAWLSEEQGYSGDSEIIYSADMRYAGESFEIETFFDKCDVDSADHVKLAEVFHQRHQEMYSHSDPQAKVQVVNLRLVIRAPKKEPRLGQIPSSNIPAQPRASRIAWFSGEPLNTRVYQRSDLCAGQRFEGPAVVAQDDCTTVVPPGWGVHVDEFGNLRLAKGEK
ncbi:hydantoinase/oxoprolinase family protein [Mesorhizobium sp.]|uniref:hydantoinase/oxoprolinase family protein n=1 Tax=Mesorhizobium sp. TaxID=1871066 RepID=UPI000FE898D6|nr:hydantoinase/oxoprolinase family protein [Mesorhizobium sp.]RWA97311.1 MAG: hydantoinase/oxoprolinase family protein [Mesorhizobium sp.]